MATPVRSAAAQARLDFRIEPAQKETIERAASLLGLNVSQFAVSTLVQRAHEVVQEHGTVVLSDRDRDIFLALIDSDAKANVALIAAAKRYRKHQESSLEPGR